MNDYEITLVVEPIDKLEKAEQDLLKAIASFENLTATEQAFLIRKFLGVEWANLISGILKQYITLP